MRRLGKPILPPKNGNNSSHPNPEVKSGGLRAAFSRQPMAILLAVVVLACLTIGINVGVILLVNNSHTRTIFSDVLSPLLDLTACVILFYAAKYSAIRSRRLAFAWGTIAFATLFYFLGGFTWLILEVGLKEPPFPSIADGLYLAYYPLFFVGAFLLAEKPATIGEFATRALDIGIILGSALIGFWTLLLGPTINSSAGQPLLEQTILVAYPVGDLVLIGALLLILYNPSKRQGNIPVYFLAASLGAVVVTDFLYSYQSLLGTYVSGRLLDLGWVVGSIFSILAGISQWVDVRSANNFEKNQRWRKFLERLKASQSYLPYIWLTAVCLLFISGEMGFTPLPMGVVAFSLEVGGIIGLVVIRQVITLSENNKLSTRLQISVGRVQAQASELEKTNQELQTDIAGRKQAENARTQSEDLFRALFELSPDAIVLIDPQVSSDFWPILDCNAEACRMNGYARDEIIGHDIDIINAIPGSPAFRNDYLKQVREAGIFRFVAEHRRKNGTAFFAEVTTMLLSVGGRELLVGIDHDITERKRAEEEIQQRLGELEAINTVSTALRVAQTLDEMLPILLDQTLEVIHAAQGSIWLYDPAKDELAAAIARGYDEAAYGTQLFPVKSGRGIVGRVFASGQPYVSGNFQMDPGLSETTRQVVGSGIGGAAVPIRAMNDIIGTFVVNIPLPRELTPSEVRLLTTLSEIAGNAIRRTNLHQETNRHLQQLTALSEIDRAITSSVDLQFNLAMVLKQVVAQLGVHAADVLLLNPASQMLEPVAASGFRTRLHEQTRQRLGEGFAGRAALDRQIITIPNLAERDDNPLAAKAVQDEGFVSYFAVPLLAKGQIQGVLEIFQRAPLKPDAEWLDFLNTLAGQAAIAIDNATLFETLQRSNFELSMAYDATIEGWSRALDLRDKETEGHTQRVTEMTVRLARTFGLGEAELAQVRWGALLHDIGKMGIPDGILLKPGPLTDEEWVIMRKHPVFAYEMLRPIQYLRAALDIPYHHHEKWDGTGYPLGLKGEQIPLTARIFAVVDVWDALRSDRPYRSAWPAEKVLDHIRSLTGTHFDPRVVKAFLDLDIPASRDHD